MTAPNKYKLTKETLKFDKNFKNDFDLSISEGKSNELDRITILTITNSHEERISIRFDWGNLSTNEYEFTTLIITETDKLFFGSRFYWGIIDLKLKKIDRIENCLTFWEFEKHADIIIVITEFLAVSLYSTGEEIDQIPIDPPFESKVFNDKIEFQSPVYGKRILKLVK